MKSKSRPLLRFFAVLVCALSAHIGPAHAAADDALGRLFHSPQKRAVLDELRILNISTAGEASSEYLRVDGIVRRTNGPNTLWINGQVQNDKAPVARTRRDSVEVVVGDGRRIEIKVGETLQLAPDANTGVLP